MDPVLADRLQFAFTVMFHYLFPIGTMGLAPFVAAYTWKAARDVDEECGRDRAILDEDLRDQLRGRRRDRHSDGVPVRNELGRVFAAQRRGRRSAARDGGHVRVLPRVDFSRRAALRHAEGCRRFARRVVGGAGLRSARGFRDSSSSRPMRGCSIRSVTSIGRRHDPARRASGALLLSPFAWWQFAHVL